MSIGKAVLAAALAAGLTGTATAGDVGFSLGVGGRSGSFGFSYNQPGWGGYPRHHHGHGWGSGLSVGLYSAPRYYGPRYVYAPAVVVPTPAYVVQPTYVVPAQPVYQVAPAPAQYQQYQPQYQPAAAPEYQSAPVNVPATPGGRRPPPPPQPQSPYSAPIGQTY